MASGTSAPEGKIVPFEEKEVVYKPLGETEDVRLTVAMVRNVLAVPSRSGQLPSSADLITFMMLCKARQLNPFVGDAYLVGYEVDGKPKFNLITAVQALEKRAEAHPEFDGIEWGVIVQVEGSPPEERQGTMVFGSEKLLGGWARVYRKDRKITFYDSVQFATYSTGRSRWAKDGAGMIAKCARAAALRKAFPTQLASLYIAEEFEALKHEVPTSDNKPPASVPKTINDVAAQMKPRPPQDDDSGAESPKTCTPIEASKADNAEIVQAYRDRIAAAKKKSDMEQIQEALLNETELSDATAEVLSRELQAKFPK